MRICRCINVLLISLCLLCAGCVHKAPESTPEERTAQKQEEVRAVWISCFDLPPSDEICTEKAFRRMADEMIGNIRKLGLNTVFLHVRPFSDAMYRSAYFPYSAYISGKEGLDPGFDALQIFCDCAKEYSVSLHAWINPFRIGSASNLDERADTNPAKRILLDKDHDNDRRVVNVDGTLYYDPANKENQELVLDGVCELLQNYAIDGVHIDDYFYPTSEPFIDQKDYDEYLAADGTMSRDDWRRFQINALVSRLFTCTKSFGSNKIFSVSPALDIQMNRTTLFADVARWAAFDGYCDWLIPQVYVGFEHETQPFCDVVKQWRSLERSKNVRLLFGLSAYKSGTEDTYAGSGRNEWIENTDILSRQIKWLRSSGQYFGFALFSYSYIFGGKMSDNSILEMNSVMSVL